MWYVYICAVVMAVMSVGRVFNQIQLNGYAIKPNKAGCIIWLWQLAASAIGAAIMCATMNYIEKGIFEWAGMLFLLLPVGALYVIDFMTPHKTPLKYTKRIIRLYISYTVLVAIFAGLLVYYGDKVLAAPILLPCLFAIITPIAYSVTAINMPMENAIKHKIITKTTDAINRHKKLLKIGITGSYGKTSVKYYLATMLKMKYNVLASKDSYNTPMGAAITVRDLTEDTDILIMEMGARRKGDIREMCDIIKPDIGILTGIAEQHLTTFKSLNTVMETKFELITALPPGGAAFFNGNDENVRKLFYRATQGNKYLSLRDSGYIFASNITLSINGMDFTMHIGDNSYRVRTVLLGRHNIDNIILAANVANYLGLSDEEIMTAIQDIKPVPHRMEVIRSGKLIIIDDSYNCNPSGARQALETISELKNRKIVAVQGMVELGNKQYEENYKLGLTLSGVADFVFAIGINAKAIINGLMDGGYNPTRIIATENLDEAKKQFSNVLKADDILLLMNDLPDNYR